MGCYGSKEFDDQAGINDPTGETRQHKSGKRVKVFSKPVWKTDEALTLEAITAKREVFWDTSPHYGGAREIWDALKACCEAEDMETAKLLIEAAGVIVASSDMTICYDERGAKYELPLYVLSLPTNLAQ